MEALPILQVLLVLVVIMRFEKIESWKQGVKLRLVH